MKKSHLRLIASFLLALAGPAGAWAAAGDDPCRASDEVVGAISALPAVAKVLQPGNTLRVLAVGSATMFGPDATLSPGTITSQSLAPKSQPVIGPAQVLADTDGLGFPQQMAKVLRAAVPGLAVTVTVRGGRGLSASDTLGLIHDELAKQHYQLVLWQTGTVEAVRNTPPGEFAQALMEGAETVETAGANLVLIDAQYSRFLQANSNLDPYTQAMQQTGSMAGVMLFHRFDLMRSWVNDGQIDLERTPKTERRKTVETLHACLGAHLARMIITAARS